MRKQVTACGYDVRRIRKGTAVWTAELTFNSYVYSPNYETYEWTVASGGDVRHGEVTGLIAVSQHPQQHGVPCVGGHRG